MASRDTFLITCEHGGNRVPAGYRPYFLSYEALLATHHGYDPGALTMARLLASTLHAPLHFSTTSRLLIDLNRSLGHPRLFSEATRNAPLEVRQAIIDHYYLPYRRRAEDEIAAMIDDGRRVIHISSHSFTPVLDDEIRNADVGLLYDPLRRGEAELSRCWQSAMTARASDLKVRRNYPYTGKSDGFTAYLRRRFPGEVYLGIELEINQKHVQKHGWHWRELRALLLMALEQALSAHDA